MPIRNVIPFFAIISAITLPPAPSRAAEAFEIGPDRILDLPRGKEADGIIGDFVLRNDLIEAVVGSDAPSRKPNLFVYYDGTMTPGCLYDLTLRGKNNDQLTLFAPSNLKGDVTFVRISSDGHDGEAIIETFVSAPSNQDLEIRHEYWLRDGWDYLLITTQLRNLGTNQIPFEPVDRWLPFVDSQTVRQISVADAINPADKAGYAVRWVDREGWQPPPAEIRLAPGGEVRYSRVFAVGTSPADAFGRAARTGEPTGLVRGSVHDRGGPGIPTARIALTIGTNVLAAYPDSQGNFSFPWPAGNFSVQVTDVGRADVKANLSVEAGTESLLEVPMGPRASVGFDIRDEQNRSIPCKAQFLATNGTVAVNLGPENRAHGCKDQWHSARGQFEVPLPPGDYDVVVTHGPEFGHHQERVHLEPGVVHQVKATLRRMVDSRGWVSTDFHNHSTVSGDNTTGTEDRLINLAAEQVEFAPTTEHNRIYDWGPLLGELGLTNFVKTVAGIELTGPGAHFNAFPFRPVPYTQDAGGPRWQKDPRLNAIVLRDYQTVMPERWVQINHPDVTQNWVDRDGDGRPDGGFPGLTELIDGAEMWGLGILSHTPYQIIRAPNRREIPIPQREFVWLQLLNMGHRIWCTSVSDAHGIHDGGVGAWRMYVRSSADEPAQIEWKEITQNAKSGQSFVTTGPFLEVKTDDGTGPGGFTRAQGSLRLHVRVQCADWLDIDRVQVLVNSRQDPEYNFTRATHPDWFGNGVVKFDRDIRIHLSQDAHLIVVAFGEKSDLHIGFGTSPSGKFNPCAYNNPIFVDVDGGGFKANGDTLGYELPVKRIDVEEVRRLISTGR